MVRPLAASVITAAALLLSAGTAGAHTDTDVSGSRVTAAPTVSAAAPVSTPPPHIGIPPRLETRAGAPSASVLLVLAAAGVIVAGGSSRRRLALALALLSAVIGVDAAVHSVHHLHDPGAAASCALASGSTHAPAVLAADAVFAAEPEPACESRAVAATPPFAVRASRSDRGRAPPSSVA